MLVNEVKKGFDCDGINFINALLAIGLYVDKACFLKLTKGVANPALFHRGFLDEVRDAKWLFSKRLDNLQFSRVRKVGKKLYICVAYHMISKSYVIYKGCCSKKIG